jgi:hypothetical protein
MYTELAVWFLSSLEMLTEAGTLCVCVSPEIVLSLLKGMFMIVLIYTMFYTV